VLTSDGLVAATAGGPVVTSVVPVISLRRLSVQDRTRSQTAENLPEERAVVSNIISTNATWVRITQKQTVVDAWCHSSFGNSTSELL
jgi:hypothetical protein